MANAPAYVPREYLSVTSIMEFIRCPRKFFFSKSGLTLAEEPIAPLYGTAMHKAVPVVLTAGLDPGIQAFDSVWENRGGDDKRNPRRAKAQLGHFHHSHSMGRSIYSFEKPPQGGIDLQEDTSPLEVPAVLDVGLDVPLVVRIDGLVRHRDTDELWGWEFKTVSGWQWNKIFENMEFHPQVLAYTLALRTLTGQKVRGMMVEAMLIDKTKVDNMTSLIPVQEHLLDGVLTWLRYWGTQLLACEKRFLSDGVLAFPQNFAGCSAYPHYYLPSFPCDFANLCRVSNWENMVPMYHVREDHKFIKLTTGESNG